MASSKKLFRTKSPKFEEDFEEEISAPKRKGKNFENSFEKELEAEYTVASKGKLHSISPKAMQKLKLMGCNKEYVTDLLHTIEVLENFSNRTVEPQIFEDVKRRYHLGMGIMASIASLSNLKLSDRGIDLRGLARFYSRNRQEIGDVEELERFVNWILARGEPVKGVPSAWRHYVSLNRQRKRKPARPSARRSAKRRVKKSKKTRPRKAKKAPKKRSKKRRR
jgi:hypothetical protein